MSSLQPTSIALSNVASDDDLFWIDEPAPGVAGPQARPIGHQRVALTPMQSRLWLLHQMATEPGAYNIFSAFRVEGMLDGTRFAGAVQALQQRHEILRTGFCLDDDGRVYQQPVPVSESPFQTIDLRPHLACTREEEAMTWVERHRVQPFELGAVPPWSMQLIQLQDDCHLFTLCIHHILLDAFSIGLLLHDLSRLYQGEALPAPALHFADLVWWDQAANPPDVVDRCTRRVIQRLDGAERLRLPEDGLRRPGVARVGETLQVHLGPELAAAIERQASAAHATPFMVIGAAYSAALATFSHQSDFILGTSMLAREHAGTERVPGIFVEMLPLRCRVTGEQSLSHWLLGFRDAALDAFEDLHASYQDVVRSLGFAGTTSGDPLVSVALSLFDEQSEIESLFPGLSIRQVAEQRGARFDMEMSIRPSAGHYTGTLIWDSTLLGSATVRAFLSHFETLLRQGLADPHCPLGRLDTRWPATFPVQQPQPATSPRLEARFSAMARQQPEAVALSCAGQHLSYQALDAWSDRVAAELLRMGVRPGDLVGLAARRDLHLMPGLLGILKAGAAYVPLDPAYPATRLQTMAEDAQVRVCVCSDAETLPPEGALACRVDRLNPAAPPDGDLASDLPALPQGLSADALAYVLFTSGSTGQPKGVCVSHHNVQRLFDACAAWFAFGPHDVWTLFHSYAFDFSVWEMFGALLHGGRLVVVPADLSRDPPAFAELLRREQVSFLNQTPSAFAQTAAAVLARDPADRPAALRHVVFGGEALQPGTLRDWLQVYGDQRPQLTNMYGITETTVHVSYRPIRWADLAAGRHSPIGIPIPDLGLRLVNAQGVQVPHGAIGEIEVLGAGVTQAYWRREDLSRERFGCHADGQRYYRSGDLARVDAHGELLYIGRADQQVKVRGFRIELGDIQAALLAQPGVAGAEVLVHEKQAGDQRLVAYVTATEAQLQCADLRQQEAWTSTFDSTYTPASCDLSRPDFSGWLSSYDNQPIAHDEMLLWLRETLDRLQALRPRRVLEIGCGTGMLLAGLAPQVAHYCGIDASPVVLERLRAQVAERGWQHVELHALAAHDLASLRQLDGSQPYDLVLINSVVQYFPSSAYLGTVLRQAADLLARGGVMFIGDLRAQATESLHHLSVALHSPGLDPQDPSALREAWARSQALEAELLLDPGLLAELLAERQPLVWPRLKQFQASNELSRLRYDCVVYLDAAASQPPTSAPMALTASPLHELEQVLLAAPERAAVLEGVGNQRLDAELTCWARLNPGAAPVQPLAEPGALMKLATRLDRPCASMWLPHADAQHQAPGRFTLAFGPVGGDGRSATQALPPLSTKVNQPAQSQVAQDFVLELREQLKTVLPAHMRPAVIRLLPRFPLTPTGKLDRKALPDPFEQESHAMTSGSAAQYQDAVEQQLADIMAELLHIEAPKRDASFFDLGGHSLLATRLAAQIRRHFGQAPALREIFAAPTVAALAQALRPVLAATHSPASPPVAPLALQPRPAAWAHRVPATAAQRRFYFLQQLAPHSSAYHISISLRLSGALDPAALQQALSAVQARHEALRTHFQHEGDDIVQCIEAPAAAWIDLRVSTFSGPEQALHAMLQQAVAEPFDLAAGPVLRVRLWRLDEREHVLGVVLHHIHADGASLRVLIQDLNQAYSQAVRGQPASLPTAALQPGDVALWQRARHDANWRDRQHQFWRQALSDLPEPIEWPRSDPQPAPAEPLPGLHVHLSALAWAQVQRQARHLGLTPYPLFLGAWALALARHTGQRDLVVGSVLSNRDQAELHDVVMALINTLPLRLRLPEAGPAGEWLQRVAADTLAATEHGELPLDELVEACAPVLGNRRRQSLFQSLVSWQAFEQAELQLPDLIVAPLPLEPTQAKTDLQLTVFEQADPAGGPGLAAHLVFDARRVSAGLAQALTEAWSEALQGLCNTEATVEGLSHAPSSVLTAPTPALATPTASDRVPVQLAPDLPPGTPAPGEPLLPQLCALWARLLHCERVGPDDDFFELGGSSLLLLRVARDSSLLLQQPVPLALLYEARTCRELLRLLAQESQQTPTDPLLIPLGPRTGKPKLFVLPDISGQLLQVYPLGIRLSEHFEVWGLRVPAQDPAPSNFGELVRPLMRALRSVQPNGPYRLIGYSYGVQLAAQMAYRLEAIGEPVACLLSLDAPPMPPGPPVPEAADELWRWRQIAGTISRAFFEHPLELPLEPLRALPAAQRAASVLATLRTVAKGPLPLSAEELQAFWEVYGRLGTLALPAFMPLEAPVHSWVCGDATAREDAARRWAEVAQPVTLHAAGGQHETLMHSPQVDALVAGIFQVLGVAGVKP